MTRRTILLTRPLADSIAFSKKLEEQAFEVLHCPFLLIENIPFPNNFNLAQYDALIFTSKNAVRSFVQQTSHQDKNIQIYAVGSGTAQELKNNGFTNIHHTPEHNAKGLIQDIEQGIQPNKKHLYIRGNVVSVNITATLQQQNPSIKIDEVIAYNSIKQQDIQPELQDRLTKGDIDYITFFSERTAQAFHEAIDRLNLNRTLSNTKCLCFSDKVLCSVSNLNWLSTHTCKTPSMEGMIDLIETIETKNT